MLYQLFCVHKLLFNPIKLILHRHSDLISFLHRFFLLLIINTKVSFQHTHHGVFYGIRKKATTELKIIIIIGIIFQYLEGSAHCLSFSSFQKSTYSYKLYLLIFHYSETIYINYFKYIIGINVCNCK